MISIEKKLQQAHKGYAYELLELQMAVEDEKLGCQPSITQITKLIQLYMIGVQVLQSIADPRFVYFHNKIHTLMLKKHIVKKLHQASGNKKSEPIVTISKAELKDKKDEYEINCYFNQGQVDLKKVKEILNFAQSKQIEAQSKIKSDIKKQQDRLQERIKQRKMRSQAGSVKKYDPNSNNQLDSPPPKKKQANNKDIRMEYYQKIQQNFIDLLPKNNKVLRTNSGSLQKVLFQRKYGRRPQHNIPGSGDKTDLNDAI